MKLTADTITDEQIREEMDRAWTLYADACRALGFSPINGTKYADPESAREHRARCAEIWNARHAKDDTCAHGRVGFCSACWADSAFRNSHAKDGAP